MKATMTPAQIRRRFETIERHQERWELAEKELQTICKHPSADKKYRGDSGNWDRSQDSYWIEFKCPDCGKRWIEDQ
jgi:hypothetical protein